MLTFSANEMGVTFECSLDGSAFASCGHLLTIRGLTDGLHTFAVRATTPRGNQDPTPATYAWTVAPPPDLEPPETTIITSPPTLTESVDATFVFSSSEAGSTFVCAVDGESFNACTSPVQLIGLSVGLHTFAVRATDPAGNDEAVPASHAWTVRDAEGHHAARYRPRLGACQPDDEHDAPRSRTRRASRTRRSSAPSTVRRSPTVRHP